MLERHQRSWVFGWRLAACALLPALVVAGCGRTAYKIVPASGRVTLDGKPMANIGVSFQPMASSGAGVDAGPPSYAVTDADGRFQLQTRDKQSGAVAGKHAVTLTLYRPAAPTDSDLRGKPVIEPLPPRAYNGDLVFEVPANGDTQIQFDF